MHRTARKKAKAARPARTIMAATPLPQELQIVSKGVHGTVTDLARATGISVSHASLILRGLRRPSVTVLAKMAKSLGITSDRLIDCLERRQEAAA